MDDKLPDRRRQQLAGRARRRSGRSCARCMPPCSASRRPPTKTHRKLRRAHAPSRLAELGETRAKLDRGASGNAASRERRLRRLGARACRSPAPTPQSLERQSPARKPDRQDRQRSAATSPPRKRAAYRRVQRRAPFRHGLFDALDRLLTRGKIEPARLLADEMLRGDPEMVDALRIRALAKLAQGDRPGALGDLRAVFGVHLQRHEPLEAARAMLRWIGISGVADAKMAHLLYASLARESAGVTLEARQVLIALRESSPEQYATLRSWCQPALAGLLFAGDDEPGTGPGGNVSLPVEFAQLTAGLQTGRPPTAKGLIAAIDQSDVAAVTRRATPWRSSTSALRSRF